MENLLTITVCAMFIIAAVKTLTFYCIAKIRTSGHKQITAEELIANNYKIPNKDKIIQVNRSEAIEREYIFLKDNFKTLLQLKRLNRKDLLAIRKYLSQNVKEYEHKKFKNDAHAIYTMLMADDLQLSHIKTIQMFLVNK